MVKATITITLDHNLLELARIEGMNLSGTFNDMLKGYLANRMYVVPKKEEKLDEEMLKMEGKITKLKMEKEKFNRERRKKEEELAKIPPAVRIWKEKGLLEEA